MVLRRESGQCLCVRSGVKWCDLVWCADVEVEWGGLVCYVDVWVVGVWVFGVCEV